MRAGPESLPGDYKWAAKRSLMGVPIIGWHFPEGTRSQDGIVRDFKVGGFCAAVRQGVPVVPIAIEGTHRLMRNGAFDLGHGFARARGRRSSSCIARSAATSPKRPLAG